MPRAIDDAHEPRGAFKRKCPVCGKKFTTDEPRKKYDSEECKKRAAFQRYYEKHGDQVRERMRIYQKQKRKK